MRGPLFCALRKALFTGLAVVGGVIAWQAAPKIEAAIYPVVKDSRIIPYDPLHPERLVLRLPDRICFRIYERKVRGIVSRFWAVTLVQSDGTRIFTNPIDARTGRTFSSKDTYAAGFVGEIPICVDAQDADPRQSLTVESYSLYEPEHGFWLLPFRLPPIPVPAVIEER